METFFYSLSRVFSCGFYEIIHFKNASLWNTFGRLLLPFHFAFQIKTFKGENYNNNNNNNNNINNNFTPKLYFYTNFVPIFLYSFIQNSLYTIFT